MSILTGQEIINQLNNKHIKITNFDKKRIYQNSYLVTLGNKISFYSLTDYAVQIGQISKDSTFENYGMIAIENPQDSTNCGYIRAIPYLDSMKENKMLVENIPDNGYILLPRILYLIEINEYIWSDKYLAEVSGISNLSRLGIIVNKSSGYSNINHEVKYMLTVEVIHPIKIYKGMKIGQVYFHTMNWKLNYLINK